MHLFPVDACSNCLLEAHSNASCASSAEAVCTLSVQPTTDSAVRKARKLLGEKIGDFLDFRPFLRAVIALSLGAFAYPGYASALVDINVERWAKPLIYVVVVACLLMIYFNSMLAIPIDDGKRGAGS